MRSSFLSDLDRFRPIPGQLVQTLPTRIVSLGWVVYHLAALASISGFLGFVLYVGLWRASQ